MNPKSNNADKRYCSYVSLTDWLKERTDSPATVIITWLRSRNTLEFLRQWEVDNNPRFDEREYRKLLAEKSITITPRLWCVRTNAIDIVSRHCKK